MDDDAIRIAVTELVTRAEKERKTEAFTADFLTAPQHKWRLDKSQYRIAMCSRRAGKTVVAAWEMIAGAMAEAKTRWIYIALTRKQAKELIWDTLTELLKRFSIDHDVNLTTLTITFPNGASIRLAGCENERQMNRLLGGNFRGIYVDEGQSFPTLLKMLIERVLGPMLIDNPDSQLSLMGTPPPRLSGYFYETWQLAQISPDSWSPHSWTMADNLPMLAGRDPNAVIAAVAKRRGVAVDDPTIQREFLGRLVQDENALIFPLRAHNFIDEFPVDLESSVIGVDLGWDDPTAISVLEWAPSRNDTYLTHEEGDSKLTTAMVRARLDRLHALKKPFAVVADSGGAKQTVESMNDEFAAAGSPVFLEAAEKSGKPAAVTLLADYVRSGAFKCKATSKFAEEAAVLEWAYDANGRKVFPKNLRVLGRHFDSIHSVLYGWRKVQSVWVRKPTPVADPVHDAAAAKAAHLRKIQRGNDPLAGLFSEDDCASELFA